MRKCFVWYEIKETEEKIEWRKYGQVPPKCKSYKIERKEEYQKNFSS